MRSDASRGGDLFAGCQSDSVAKMGAAFAAFLLLFLPIQATLMNDNPEWFGFTDKKTQKEYCKKYPWIGKPKR